MKLKEYRESQRIGPVEAAKQLSVSYTSYYRWEEGRVTPGRIQQLRIMDWSGGKVCPEDWVQAVQS